MKCNTCENEQGFKFCKALDSIDRVTIRQICPVCGGFVGQVLSRASAENCGYELELMTGDNTAWRVDSYLNTVFYPAMNNHYEHSGNLAIGYQSRENYTFHTLFCDTCHETIGTIPNYVIESCTDTDFIELVNNAVDITPLAPIKPPKIPAVLYEQYRQYTASNKWKIKRDNRMALDNHECALCFTTSHLQVHHITYDRIFNEKMSDLLTVCKSCHEIIHGREFE